MASLAGEDGVGLATLSSTLRAVQRTYTIEGDYRIASAKDVKRVRFDDKVKATSILRAFTLWERKHQDKPLLRVRSITPLW